MKCFFAALANFIHILNIGTALAQNPRATDIFHVRNSGEPGGCTVSQIALIEIWLEEVHLLHAAARNGFFNGAGHFGNAMHTSWILGITWNGRDMAPKSTELWEKLKGRINEVTKFLNGDGLTSPQSPSRPGIFCNDAFATYAPWEEPVKDENRNRIPYEIDENGDVTRWWTIREVFPKQVDNLDRRNPFWIESLNGYEFDVNGFDTLCGKASVFAATSFPAAQIEHDDIKTADFERNIWFCPRTWSKPEVNSPHRVPNLSTLLTDDGYPKGGTGEGLDRFATISCTLYHELYHLTDYQGTTHDRGVDLLDIIKQATLAVEHDLEELVYIPNNPESFVLFAVASYIYQNPPAGKNPILFAGGLPSQEH